MNDLIRRLEHISTLLKAMHTLGDMAGSRPLPFETIDEAIRELSKPKIGLRVVEREPITIESD